MPPEEILRLSVELEPESGPISGTIAEGNSRAHRFDGMLDLLSAIESIRATHVHDGEVADSRVSSEGDPS